jgi:predicted phage terminase large subunit-like protein
MIMALAVPKTMRINLPPLHPGQHAIRTSPARFKIIAAGRRWGKTRFASALELAIALHRGRCWWVAPTYPIASIAWRQFKVLAQQIPGTEIREVERSLTFASGGFVQMKTADSPSGLRGEGLDMVVVDEAAHVLNWDEVWLQALRPSLSDRRGKAMMISTPKGHNHFYELYQQAEHSEEWARWHFPSWTNPYLERSEIEAAQAQLPALVFRQEYGAEFVQLSGAMFRREFFTLVDELPEQGRWVRFWDLAASQKTSADFTVGAKVGFHEGTLMIADVVRGRWEWPDVLKIIRQTALMDGPGVGVGIEDVGVQKGLYQMLRREPLLAGIAIRPIKVVTDKITRANPWLARAEQGQIVLKRASWNAAFLDEVCAFPETAHDDIVDSISGAVQMVMGSQQRFAPVGT